MSSIGSIGLGCSTCNSIGINSLFGDGNQSIKYSSGDLIATSGPNVFERLILSDLRVPYKQIVKSRVLLKPGQQNYLLNYSGLGDNATFLALYAKYDPNSRNEANNYLEYYYYMDQYRKYFMDQILTLSGNSTHRIPQLYINNPNMTYSVSIDIMAAVIDDETSFFYGFTGPALTNAIQFTGLRFSAANGFDIQTYQINGYDIYGNWTTLAVLNNANQIVAFLDMDDINSLQLSGNIVIVDDTSMGVIYLQFVSMYDADQAYSAINFALENRTIAIPVSPLNQNWDDTPPLIVFTDNIDLVGGTFGATTTSTYSNTFIGKTISLTAYSGVITKGDFASYSLYSIVDNRDGVIIFTNSNLAILDTVSASWNSVTFSGTFSLYYSIHDLAGNPTVSTTNFVITLPVE